MNQTDNKITLSFVGDLLCPKEFIESAYLPETNCYDFSPSLVKIKKYFSKSDYVIGNLETPLAGRDMQYAGSPGPYSYGFNAPESYLQALIDAGIDLFTTANNHCLDRGELGLLKTLETLDKYGADHVGTYASEYEQNTVFIKNIKGAKIAFLNYTFGINFNVHSRMLSPDKFYLVNLLSRPELQKYEDYWNVFPSLLSLKLPLSIGNKLLKTCDRYDYASIADKVLQDIQSAKSAGADLVVVLPHMGVEFTTTPLKFSQSLVDKFFAAGADIIIGGHPHVLQPMEFRHIKNQDGTMRTGFVIYSLGNFLTANIPYWPSDLCLKSIILNIHIRYDESTHNATFDSVSYVPTVIQTRNKHNKHEMELVSIADLNLLSTSEKEHSEMIKLNQQIQSILGIQKTDDIISETYLFKSENSVKKRSFNQHIGIRNIFHKLPMRVLNAGYKFFISLRKR